MRLVSPFLKQVVYPGLSKAGFLRHTAGVGPVVITYHGVLPAGYEIIDPVLDGNLLSAEKFRQQLQFLSDHYKVITFDDFLLWLETKCKLLPRSVLLTCDDGMRNNLTEMLPILQEFGFTCLFFVTGDSLQDGPAVLWHDELYLMFLAAPETLSLNLPDLSFYANAEGRREKHSLWWVLVKRLSRFGVSARQALLEEIRVQLGLAGEWNSRYHEDSAYGRRFIPLNAVELNQMLAAGMHVGAHTVSHPVLSQMPPELAWNEISESKLNLEQVLGREIPALAYPFGDSSSVTSRELQMAARAGFKCAFLNADGGMARRLSSFALPRVHVTAGMSLAGFEANVSGFSRSLRQLFQPDDELKTVDLPA